MVWSSPHPWRGEKENDGPLWKITSKVSCRVLIFIFGITALSVLWKLTSKPSLDFQMSSTSASRATNLIHPEQNESPSDGKLKQPEFGDNCTLPLHADRHFGIHWCEEDKEQLVEAIVRNLIHLGVPKLKRKKIRDIFLETNLNLVDQYGFELINSLRGDFHLMNQYLTGKITAQQLIFERHKLTNVTGTSPKKSNKVSTTPEQKENLLLTTYFITQRDPNHPEAPMNLSMPAIEDFLETTKPFFHTMHAVIFIDFKNPPNNTGIEFIYTKWKGIKYSINDYRYFLYLDYINTHRHYKQLLIIDMKDVKYGRDPFEYFNQQERNIFIGSQPNVDIVWMKRRQRVCWGDRKRANVGPKNVRKVMQIMKPYKELYIQPNAGILGGSFEEVVPILKEMVEIFNNSGQQAFCNSNMVVFATVIFPRWRAGKVEWGQPLHSPFREYLPPSPEYVIFHK